MDQEHTGPPFDKEGFSRIRNFQVQCKVIVFSLHGIRGNIDKVQHHLGRHACFHIAGTGFYPFNRLVAAAEFQSPRQVGVTPDAAFCLITQLFQRVRAQVPCFLIIRIGKDQLLGDLGHPLVLAFLIILTGFGKHRFGIAQVFRPLLSRGFRRQQVQVDRVGVIPAQIPLVDRFDIMVQRPVILPDIPDFPQLIRKFQHPGNFHRRIPFVGKMKRLVIDVFINCRRIFHILLNGFRSPVRPVMGLEHHIRLIPEQFFRFQDIFGPVTGIAHLGASQGVQVVHGAGAVFCQP